MKRTLTALRECTPNGERSGFRMVENPFFLKLCPRLTFNPDDAGLVKGMYIPIDYWHLIETDATLVGPTGGRQVTFDNVGRYLDDTGFIGLMTNAWIGTTSSQSDVLQPLVRKMIQTNRPFTIAVKTDTKPQKSPARIDRCRLTVGQRGDWPSARIHCYRFSQWSDPFRLAEACD
jgi:hypothetical protein